MDRREESQHLEKQNEMIVSLTEDKTWLLETIVDLKREVIVSIHNLKK